MPKRVAILQSNYIPWKGYFDIIHDVDEFIFHDDVQYTKQDWRNRNRIKTAHGPTWLTIPVGSRDEQRICEVELPRDDWAAKHWRRIQDAYGRAPHFEAFRPFLESVYRDPSWRYLSDFNQHLIRAIARDFLGIGARFRDSRDFGLQAKGQQRLLELLRFVGADVYVSGPAARAYIDPRAFETAGIELVWKDYAGYPEYPQFHPPFDHQVTILDLLFHTGPDAPRYIWGWREHLT
jgi:hypothetical protein